MRKLVSRHAHDACQRRPHMLDLRAHAAAWASAPFASRRTAASTTSTSARSARTRRSRTAGSRRASPTTPDDAGRRAARARFSLAALLGVPKSAASEPVATEPILRRLSEPEAAIVEAADLFNASQYRRTVGGIAKSLGEPRVSIVPLSGVNADVVVTVAWEISWYQYRVTPDSAQPVRLAERGHDPVGARGHVRASGTRTSTTTAASCPISRVSDALASGTDIARLRTRLTMRP